MAKSPITGNTDLVSYKILTEGAEIREAYQVTKIEVEKSINNIATARVAIMLEYEQVDDKTFELTTKKELELGKSIEIQLGYHSSNVRVFKGIIVSMEIKAHSNINQLILECSDKALKTTIARKNNNFKDKKDSAIIAAIIKDNGLEKDIDATQQIHKQLIQCNAIDWDFILRRAKANGLLVYTDDNKIFVKRPAVSSSPILEVTYGKDVISINGKLDARFQVPSIKSYGWSMDTQKLIESLSTEPSVNDQGNLSGKKIAEVWDIKDFNLYSSTPLEEVELKEWANSTLLNNRLSRIHGVVEIVGSHLAKLNTLIEIKGFGPRMNGKALITKVLHTVAEGNWRTEIGFGFSPEYFSSDSIDHNLQAGGLLPGINGLQNGKVKKIEDDPEGALRVLVDIPIIAEKGEGVWARLSNFYATQNKGAFFMPEVDDEVVVGFLNNDPRFAVILGSLYSPKISAPYKPDKENSIKAILTKNDLKLEFNDKDKIITLETPGGNKAVFSDKDKSILLKDETGNKLEMTSNGITIESPKEINISAKSNIYLASKAKIAIASTNGDIDVKANNINLTAQMNLVAKGNMNTTLEAGLNSTVKSGMNMTIQGLMVMIN